MVAAAVEPLVVGGGDRGEAGERGDAREDALGVGRVQADARELLVGQLGGLVEDRVRDAELADVVQQPGAVQVAQILAREAELLADQARRRSRRRASGGR